MSVDDVRNDPVLQLLKALPPADIDTARAAHIRHRCHGALRRQDRRTTAFGGVLEPAAVITMSAVYLSEVARRVLLLLD